MSSFCEACAGVLAPLGASPSPLSRRVLPEPERHWERINLELLPPCGLITGAMKLAVMDPANRDSELVAHSVSKCTRLGKREVMRIRRYAATHKTRLPQYELPVLLIAQADRFAQSTDRPVSRSLFGPRRGFPAGVRVRSASKYEVLVGESKRRPVRRPVRGLAIADRGEPILKPLLDNFGIYRCQGVLGRQISLGPDGRLIRRTDGRQLVEQALTKNCRLLRSENGSCETPQGLCCSCSMAG